MRLTKEQFADYEIIRLKDVQDTIDALEAELAESHAETAAVLESLRPLAQKWRTNGHHPFASSLEEAIDTAIPLHAAAALAEVKRKERLETSLTKAHTETAAVLEKVVELLKNWNGRGTPTGHTMNVSDAIRAFIPLPAAAALVEVKRKERLEEAEWWAGGNHAARYEDSGCEIRNCPKCKRLAQLRADEGAKP